MSEFLKEKFDAYLNSVAEEVACEVLEAYPSNIKRWKAKTHKPPLTAISAWVEKVLLPGINETFSKQLEIRVKKQVAEAMDGFGVDIAMLPKVPDEPVPEEIPVAPPTPPVVEPPCSQIVDTIEFKTPSVTVPAGLEANYSAGMVDWLVKHRGSIPENVLYQLNDLYFPLGGRDLCVLFPCHKTTNPATSFTLVALALDLGKAKMRMFSEYGDAMIYHARNKLAKSFLESGAQWSLWIDDDIIPPIGRAEWFKWVGNLSEAYSNQIAGRHVVTRLLSQNKKLIGGCYFSRQYFGNAMYNEGKASPQEDQFARSIPDLAKETKWVATGCMLVHRDVYLDIQKKFPELAPEKGREHWDFFLPTREWPGEDVAFCQRAIAAGHQAHVDLGLQPLHVGYASYGAHNTKPKF